MANRTCCLCYFVVSIVVVVVAVVILLLFFKRLFAHVSQTNEFIQIYRAMRIAVNKCAASPFTLGVESCVVPRARERVKEKIKLKMLKII